MHDDVNRTYTQWVACNTRLVPKVVQSRDIHDGDQSTDEVHTQPNPNPISQRMGIAVTRHTYNDTSYISPFNYDL